MHAKKVCIIRRKSSTGSVFSCIYGLPSLQATFSNKENERRPMGKNANKSRERKQQHRDTRQTAYVHHPDRLAAALAIMQSNNSRITLQSLLTAVNIGTDRENKRERLSIVLNSLDAGIILSFSSFILMLLCVLAAISYLSHSPPLPPSSSPLSLHISCSQF